MSKFEAYGIAISIGAMALALFLIRLESTNDAFLATTAESQDAAVFVANEDDAGNAVGDAVRKASGSNGEIQKLIIDDVIIGTGEAVKEGDTISVHYIGTLQNGQQFDNSHERGAPFTFTVGEGRVIQGWEQGVRGMKVGGQRVLVIPAELGYGRSGYGPIPGGATLVFAIELLEINE